MGKIPWEQFDSERMIYTQNNVEYIYTLGSDYIQVIFQNPKAGVILAVKNPDAVEARILSGFIRKQAKKNIIVQNYRELAHLKDQQKFMEVQLERFTAYVNRFEANTLAVNEL